LDGRFNIAPGLNLTGSIENTSQATDNPAELYVGTSVQKQIGQINLITGLQEKLQVSSSVQGADIYGQTGAGYSTKDGTTFSFFFNHDLNHDLRYQKPDDNLTFSITQRFKNALNSRLRFSNYREFLKRSPQLYLVTFACEYIKKEYAQKRLVEAKANIFNVFKIVFCNDFRSNIVNGNPR